MPGAVEKAAAEAYVLIEDSIQHWMRLREIIPSEEDAILRLLVHLAVAAVLVWVLGPGLGGK